MRNSNRMSADAVLAWCADQHAKVVWSEEGVSVTVGVANCMRPTIHGAIAVLQANLETNQQSLTQALVKMLASGRRPDAVLSAWQEWYRDDLAGYDDETVCAMIDQAASEAGVDEEAFLVWE